MAEIDVPISIHGEAAGTFQLFRKSLANQPLLFLAAIITIYIVLGMLYESYVHPLTILSTLPSAGVGAVLALLIFKTDFSLIALIGVILLIGIVKKNAIIMIDFAIDVQRREKSGFARGDLPRRPAALPSHHDDDHGRDPGRVAAGDRLGRRLGIAPAAGHFHRGRIAAEPGLDALHHAGGLSLSRPLRRIFGPTAGIAGITAAKGDPASGRSADAANPPSEAPAGATRFNEIQKFGRSLSGALPLLIWAARFWR